MIWEPIFTQNRFDRKWVSCHSKHIIFVIPNKCEESQIIGLRAGFTENVYPEAGKPWAEIDFIPLKSYREIQQRSVFLFPYNFSALKGACLRKQ
jgi:hypothetical protein